MLSPARAQKDRVRFPGLRVTQQFLFGIAVQNLGVDLQPRGTQDPGGFFCHAPNGVADRLILLQHPIRTVNVRPGQRSLQSGIHHGNELELRSCRPGAARQGAHCAQGIRGTINRRHDPKPVQLRVRPRTRDAH
jgi:hypothetical protein